MLQVAVQVFQDRPVCRRNKVAAAKQVCYGLVGALQGKLLELVKLGTPDGRTHTHAETITNFYLSYPCPQYPYARRHDSLSGLQESILSIRQAAIDVNNFNDQKLVAARSIKKGSVSFVMRC